MQACSIAQMYDMDLLTVNNLHWHTPLPLGIYWKSFKDRSVGPHGCCTGKISFCLPRLVEVEEAEEGKEKGLKKTVVPCCWTHHHTKPYYAQTTFHGV